MNKLLTLRIRSASWSLAVALGCAWAGGTLSLQAGTTLGVQDAAPAASFRANVPVLLESDVPVGAFQTDVLFHAGQYEASGAFTETDTVRVHSRVVEPGTMRVIVYPRSTGPMGSGVAFQVPLAARRGVVAEFPVVLSNFLVVGTDPAATRLTTSIAPRVRLRGLRDGKEVNGRFGIDLSVDAQATAGDIARVEYYIGGILLGEGSGAGFRRLWEPGVNGPFQITAIAYDSNGVQASSRTIDVNVGHIGTFLGPVKGTYVGLLQDDPATHAGTGYVTMTSSTTGAFTLRFSLGGKTYSKAGVFDPNGVAVLSLPRKLPLPPLNLRLTQSSDPAVDQIVALLTDGTINGAGVEGGTFTAEFTVNRIVWNAKLNPAPQAGAYTVLLPSGADAALRSAPLGDGWGTLSATTAGTASLKGKLADGTSLTMGAYLSKDRRIPLYAALYRGGGMASGWFSFRDVPEVSDGDAVLDWHRPADTKAKQFADGSATRLDLVASRYVPPVRNARVVPMANVGGNLSITAEDGGLLAPLARIATVNGANAVAVPVQGGEKLTLKITPKTGLFTGSFVHPNTGLPAPFSGAIFQKQAIGSGFLLSGASGGAVGIEANPRWVLEPSDSQPLGVATLPATVIKFPKAEQVLPAGTSLVTVAGTAADANGIDLVECQVFHDGELTAPEAAVGTTSWTFPIVVPTGGGGRFTVFARARDLTGERSQVVSASFRVALLKDLTVTISGGGTVTRGYAGVTAREVGRIYSVTATPARGKTFTGWSGSLTSTGRTVSFVMEEGFTLQANFTP